MLYLVFANHRMYALGGRLLNGGRLLIVPLLQWLILGYNRPTVVARGTVHGLTCAFQWLILRSKPNGAMVDVELPLLGSEKPAL